VVEVSLDGFADEGEDACPSRRPCGSRKVHPVNIGEVKFQINLPMLQHATLAACVRVFGAIASGFSVPPKPKELPKLWRGIHQKKPTDGRRWASRITETFVDRFRSPTLFATRPGRSWRDLHSRPSSAVPGLGTARCRRRPVCSARRALRFPDGVGRWSYFRRPRR
jgi:hypothetical protein